MKYSILYMLAVLVLATAAFDAIADEPIPTIWRSGTAGGCVFGCERFNIAPDDTFSTFIDTSTGRVFANADLTGLSPEGDQILIADFFTRQEVMDSINGTTNNIISQFDNFETTVNNFGDSILDRTQDSLNVFAQTINLGFAVNRDYTNGIGAQSMAAAALTDDDLSIAFARVGGRNAVAIGTHIDFPSLRWGPINGGTLKASATAVEASAFNPASQNVAVAAGVNFGQKLY